MIEVHLQRWHEWNTPGTGHGISLTLDALIDAGDVVATLAANGKVVILSWEEYQGINRGHVTEIEQIAEELL